MNIRDSFLNPPPEYSPVPFWFLNERLDEERLRWQVREMKSQHVFGAVMHPRPGLATPYLSENWFRMIGCILDEARAQGMFMWMYDDYPWASGMADHKVPDAHPDFVIRGLDHIEKIVEGPETLCWDIATETDGKAGKIVSAVCSPAMDGKPLSGGEDVTGCIDEGVLRLSIPAGAYHVAVYFERLCWNPYKDGFGVGRVADLMNPAAMDLFTSLTHNEYERRFHEFLGATLTATFTDEPPSDTPGWTRAFLDEFRRRKGYDLAPVAGSLWHDLSPSSAKVRLDWADVVGQLYEENFFGRIEAWGESCGVASTGHLLLEETLLFHARFLGDYFRAMRRLHYPGIDYIFPGRIPAVTCKLAASIANLYGRPRVISECFALTGWDFSLEHMKWMSDWQLVNGVNLLVPHAFSFATSEEEPIPPMEDNLGFRWFDCPPSMFYQQPYWELYSHYADYLRRSCWLVSQGEHVASIAIYYPIETVQAELILTKEHCNLHAFEVPGPWVTPAYIWDGCSAEQTDAHFRAAGNGLRDGGLDYDVVDDESLSEGDARDGTLDLRHGRSYQALVLPRTRWISVEVYRVIERFWQQGGTVVATGCLPSRACEGPEQDRQIQEISCRVFGVSPLALDGMPDAERSAFVCSSPRAHFLERPDEELLRLLSRAGLADFAASSTRVYAQHRRKEGVDVYYLSYSDAEPSGPVTVRLRGSGLPELLDPETGQHAPLEACARSTEDVYLELNFAPYQSFFVVLDPYGDPSEGAGDRARSVARWLQNPPGGDEMLVNGPWRVRLDGADQSPLRLRDLPPAGEDFYARGVLTWESLGPWEEKGLQEFSGGATYEAVFSWDADLPESSWVDLGEAGVAAEVSLNGQDLGAVLWRPYRLPCSGALKKGENVLRVRVLNTLANAIQAAYGTGKVPTAASADQVAAYAKFEPGRLRSGLIGPVRLLW